MAPVLLDSRGLLKTGIGMLLALLAVFAGGFMTGYQKAIVQQTALMQNRDIELPLIDEAQAEILAMALAPQPPASDAAGASIDVDKPDNILSQTQQAVAYNANTQTVSGRAEMALPHDTPTAETSMMQESVSTKAVQTETRAAENVSSDTSLAKSTGETLKSVLTKINHADTQLDEHIEAPNLSHEIIEVSKLTARYSIQVGMYGRRVNASNFVSLLEAQGLNAYLSEYLNKQQQLRYNVRFGYFENKRTALKGLKYYRENMDGKGYLVKLKQTLHAENDRSASSVPTDKTAQF